MSVITSGAAAKVASPARRYFSQTFSNRTMQPTRSIGHSLWPGGSAFRKPPAANFYALQTS
jgi:hypothetical protein